MVTNTENQTKFTTLINSIGYSGYDVIKLKQGLEIYLRKNDKKNFILCLEELFLFDNFSENENEKKISNGILSSIVNKLILLNEEEVSFIEVDKYIMIRNYLKEFSEKKDFKFLKIVTDILFDSKLSKRNNYGKAFYLKSDDFSEDLTDEESFKKFKELFESKDNNCLKYMYKILENNNSGKKRIFRNRKDNIYMIWEYLMSLDNDNNIKKVLEYKINNFFDKRNKNRFLFLSSAVDLCMFKEDYENKLQDLEKKYFDKDNYKIKKKKRDKLNLDDIYKVTDEISKDEFYKLENECVDYLNENWKECFLNEKKYENIKVKKNSKKKVTKKKEVIDKDSDEEINLKNLSEDSDSENECLESKFSSIKIVK